MGNDDLRERLKRMGVRQGAHSPRRQIQQPRRAIEDLLPGEVVDTDHGSCFLYRETYDPGYHHGVHALADLLAHRPEAASRLARDERLADVDFRQMAFVDTETTGLAGGTGTYAFLVGVGRFEGDQFTIYQFFMRDFYEEPAQLHALGELLDGLEAVVSFNGKSFDLPLLETRFIMARQLPRLTDAPHLDLLPVARRFWKYRLDSCALSSLESEVLGVRRTQDDVPGWLIPDLYIDYARNGDAREIMRVFYHNAQDILSLVTLTARQCDLLTMPLPGGGEVAGEDLFGLGRVLHDLGQLDRAEAAYVQAAHTSRSSPVREMAMRDLAYLLKRQERWAEALPWWQQLVESAGAVYACEELAKHHEWRAEDLPLAITWTQRGAALAKEWPSGPKRHNTLSDLEHRQERLHRKQGLGSAQDGAAFEPQTTR
ncbi:ribonuclease H-like domain-containing protein [Chloroflexota bacterium]